MSAPAATELGCAGIASAVRGNKSQADAIHDELLKRYESRQKFHNAMHKSFTVDGVRASLAAAASARARAAHAEPPAVHVGPLASVPFVLSSSIDVEGLPTPAGNAVLTAGKAQKDAPVVDSLRRAGAVLFGQANTGELNLASTCAHATHGTTKHPFSSVGIAGGANGGIACMVRSHAVAFGVGIDTLGDARVSAALSGCVGFRPTPGRYSREGTLSLSATLDTPAIIARSVADVQLIDACVCASGPATRADAAPLPPAAALAAQRDASARAAAVAAGAAATSPRSPAPKAASAGTDFGETVRDFSATLRLSSDDGGDSGSAIASPLAALISGAVAHGPAAGMRRDDRALDRLAVCATTATSRLVALAPGADTTALAASGTSAATGASTDAAALTAPLAGKRIGVDMTSYQWADLHPALASVVYGFLERLRKAGATIVTVPAPGADRPAAAATSAAGAAGGAVASSPTVDAAPFDASPRSALEQQVDAVAYTVLGYEAPRELGQYLSTHVAGPPEPKKKAGDDDDGNDVDEEAAAAAAAARRAAERNPKPLDSVISVSSVISAIDAPIGGLAAEKALLAAQLKRETAIPSATYAAALTEKRPALQRSTAALFAEHRLDAFVYPATALPAMALRESTGEGLVEHAGKRHGLNDLLTRNTRLASAIGFPAVTVPCGMTKPKDGAPKTSTDSERMPVAVELMAQPDQDEDLLALARACQGLQSLLPDPIVVARWNEAVTL